jgi:threonine/homoserine/homoserine lactone efflux protein
MTFVPDLNILLAYTAAAVILVITPGPDMTLFLGQTLTGGRARGIAAYVGASAGLVVHTMLAAFGLSALLAHSAAAFGALKIVGVAYLLWLAWQALKPGARGLFEPRLLPPDSPAKLVWMGFATNCLNPKIAVFYVSIFTQFLDPARGSVWAQSVALGGLQITISFAVNTAIIHAAGWVADWFREKPFWARVQRWILATVFGGLAMKLAAGDQR